MKQGVRINLNRIPGARTLEVELTDGSVKDCVVIPVLEAGLIAGKNGYMLNMAAVPMREKSQYGDTHILKQELPMEQYRAMSEEERRNRPILGNITEYDRQ